MIESGKEFNQPEAKSMKSPSELAERAREIRGNRHGPRSWMRAIWQTMDEAGVTEQEERSSLLVKISDELDLENKRTLPPGAMDRADKAHERDWLHRHENRQD